MPREDTDTTSPATEAQDHGYTPTTPGDWSTIPGNVDEALDELAGSGGGGGAEEMDDLDDADTTTDAPAKNDTLKWDGTNWVPAVYNYVFEFSIASFTDGEATTQLIGVGVWEADDGMVFGATYNNGPPTSADIMLSIDGAGYLKVGEMSGPAFTGGTNTEGDINYPAARDDYLRFRLDADDPDDPDTDEESRIYFRNYRFWGVISAAQRAGIAEADIEALSKELSNSTTISKSIDSGVDEFVCIAYPAAYSTLDTAEDYEDDGNTEGKFDSIALAWELIDAALAITNTAGFTENYKVYAAVAANLGDHAFYCSTSTSTIDRLYYGVTVKADTYLEADIEGLATDEITNDNTQVWDSVDADPGEYLLFAFPKRLGLVDFYVGGFLGGFQAPETVSVTNANGHSEDYYAWRSTHAGLGATVVETKEP